MDDVIKALLGDRKAQERVTDRGKPLYAVSCKKHFCGAYGCAHRTKAEAIEYWNTRPAMLTAEQLARLGNGLRG